MDINQEEITPDRLIEAAASLLPREDIEIGQEAHTIHAVQMITCIGKTLLCPGSGIVMVVARHIIF